MLASRADGTRPSIGGTFTETAYRGAMNVRTQGTRLTPSKTISRLWTRATPGAGAAVRPFSLVATG
jgi:hypothetical protein